MVITGRFAINSLKQAANAALYGDGYVLQKEMR